MFLNIFFKFKKKINIIIFIGEELSSELNPIIRQEWYGKPYNFIYDYKNFYNHKEIFYEFYNYILKLNKKSTINNKFKNFKKILLNFQNNKKYNTYIITDSIFDFLENNDIKNVIHLNGKISSFFCENCSKQYRINYWHSMNCKQCGQINTIRPNVNFIDEQVNYRETEKIYKKMKNCDYFIQINSTNESLLNFLATENLFSIYINKDKTIHNDLFNIVINNQLEKNLSSLSKKITKFNKKIDFF